MKEVENAEAVLILGEDLTNTAPMLALAVRQSVRRVPMAEVKNMGVPEWNDAAAREIIQDNKGPLYVATPAQTKLDSLATSTFRAAPQDIARLGFAVANCIDASAPSVNGLSNDERELAESIAKSLLNAERPVVISGTSCRSKEVMQASAQVAWALNKKGKKAQIVLTLPDCNSLGLAMLGGGSLEEAMSKVQNGQADTVVILENDIYRQTEATRSDEFLSACRTVIVIDHSRHATTAKAHWLLPAGTFAESDGTIINNEGRAQRYFQVYEAGKVRESWRWLTMLGAAGGNTSMQNWKNFDYVTAAVSNEVKALKGVEGASPPSSQRMADGQRVPRQPHRYSGRTAMLAHHAVSEPKPPEDPDSGLSYTMEGSRTLPPSAMIPFFWSPGWNSVQSVNKYQEEVGAALRGGNPGVRLIEPSGAVAWKYFTTIPEPFKPAEGKIWMVPVHHIFGSEELSARSEAVSLRVPRPYLMLSTSDRGKIKPGPSGEITIGIGQQSVTLPVAWSDSLKSGMAGWPVGLPGSPVVALPAWGTLRN